MIGLGYLELAEDGSGGGNAQDDGALEVAFGTEACDPELVLRAGRSGHPGFGPKAHPTPRTLGGFPPRAEVPLRGGGADVDEAGVGREPVTRDLAGIPTGDITQNGTLK
jgi:hypothetical protein